MNHFKEDDDFSFGNRKFGDDEELKHKYMEINRIENESLESTYRALRSLNETEEIGIKTAAVRF